MNILSSLVLLSFQQTTLAGTPYYNPVPITENFKAWKHSDKMGYVESVELGGKSVDIPLYSDLKGQPELLTYISTTADGQDELSVIAPASSSIIITEDFANENEWEIKVTNKRLIPVPDDYKTGGEVRYVEIPELYVGSMRLVNVVAFVPSKDFQGFEDVGSFDYGKILIGLKALPISYSLLQSEGILRATLQENGATLRKEFQGTELPYKEEEIRIGRLGKWKLLNPTDTLLGETSLVVQASFGDGKPVSTMLAPSLSSSLLDRHYSSSSDTHRYRYDVRSDYLSPTLGKETLSPNYVRRLTMIDTDDANSPVAVLGQDFLLHYDLVVDQEEKIVSLKKNAGYKRSDAFAVELEKVKNKLKEAQEEKPDEDGEETEASLPVGEINAVISLLQEQNRWAETEEYYQLLLDDEEEKTDCSIWLEYAWVQREAGNVEKAKEAYQEAARLYHSWWDIELNTRMDINKAQGKMDEEEVEAAKEAGKGKEINSTDDGWYISQPGSCYIADGSVAHMDLLLGNHEAVEENYRENLDLDASLAQALGNTALVQGKTELAHEAYRQAILLENGRAERGENRFGLALVYADQGKWEQADALFREAMGLKSHSLITYLWADQMRTVLGEEKTIQNIEELIKDAPRYTAAKLALLREYHVQLNSLSAQIIDLEQKKLNEAGEIDENVQAEINALNAKKTDINAKQKQAQKETEAHFREIDFIHSNNPLFKLSAQIEFYTLVGQLEEAEKLAKEASPYTESYLSLAKANLYSMQGKSEEAQKELKKAVTLYPSFAGHALFLK